MVLTAAVSYGKPTGQHCSVCKTLDEKCSLVKSRPKAYETMWQAIYHACIKPVQDCMKNCRDSDADHAQLERLALKVNKMQRAYTRFQMRILKIQMSS